MTRFQTITEKHGDNLVYLLRDLESGASARILPALGANCMELRLAPAEGHPPVAVINDMAHINKLTTSTSRYGIPILFPWPSAIPKAEFAFDGKRIDLNGPNTDKSAYHGFVNNAAWRVVRSDCDNTGAWVTCAISSNDCPSPIARHWPFPFTFQVTWRLSAQGFSMQFEATNTGNGPMPMGLGLHPYFTLPFGKPGTRADCRLTVDATHQWDLDKITDVAPGGTPVPQPYLPQMTFDVTPKSGTPIKDVAFNHVLNATFDNDTTRASIIDPAAGLKMTVIGGRDFKTWVIFSPKDRTAISIEPWTMIPNAFNLAAANQKDNGTIRLEPNKPWTGEVRFELSKL